MKFLRIPALLAVTVLALTACSQEEEVAKPGVDTNGAANPLLAYAPA